MNMFRKATLIAPTALLAGAMMLPVGVTAASATPSNNTASAAATQVTQAPSSDRDWQRGYRDGYRDGWREAKYECEGDRKRSFNKRHKGYDDYARGYDKGFERGYDAYKKKHWKDCDHH